MSDAGDENGRADFGSGAAITAESPHGEAVPGLSKRAARRRRKRRMAKAGSGLERQAKSPAPKPVEENIRPANRIKRPKRPPQSAAKLPSMRGVRNGSQARPQKSGNQGSQRPEARGDGQRGKSPAVSAPDPRPESDQPDVVWPVRYNESPLYAALDLGTNNCRLLIAEPQDRGFRVVDAFSRIVRLGEGIGRTGRLSEAAMDRAVDALAVCRQKMGDLQVRRMRLIATEACRSASNGEEFLRRVRRETGMLLEIVDRETEARLAVAGCATLVDPAAQGVVLFDIGGGSSELVWLDLRQRGDARGFALTRFIRAWTSLPVGVVTLSERHGGKAVTPAIFEVMVDEVAAMIAAFDGMDEVDDLIQHGQIHMLGTSGTVTTLAGMHLGLKRYDRRRIDGVWLNAVDIDQTTQSLVNMEFEERVANPCIGHDRADLVLAGCAILEAIRRRWPCQRLRVADRGLREGILVELMARDGVWRRRPVVRS